MVTMDMTSCYKKKSRYQIYHAIHVLSQIKKWFSLLNQFFEVEILDVEIISSN